MTQPRQALVEQLQDRIGYRFDDEALLERALVHRSWAHDRGVFDEHGLIADNERLEFLGDGVIQSVTAEYLVRVHPAENEGALSVRRTFLVNGQQLAAAARAWGLDTPGLVRLGRSMLRGDGADSASMLGDAFEAVVGAVFLDGGYQAARRILRAWMARVDLGEDILVARGAKTALQELVQADPQRRWVLRYRVVGEGPAHERSHRAIVFLVPRGRPGGEGGLELGRGRGRRKKDSEQAAAAVALELLQAQGLPALVPDDGEQAGG